MNLSYILEKYEGIEAQVKAICIEAEHNVFFTEKVLNRLLSVSAEDVIFSNFDIFEHFVMIADKLFELSSYRSSLFLLLKEYLETYPEFAEKVVKKTLVKLVKKAIAEDSTSSFNTEFKSYILENANDFIKNEPFEDYSADNIFALNKDVANYILSVVHTKLLTDYEDTEAIQLFDRYPIFLYLYFSNETYRLAFIDEHYNTTGLFDNYTDNIKQHLIKFLIQSAGDTYKEINFSNITVMPAVFRREDGSIFELPYSYTGVTKTSSSITVSGIDKATYFLLKPENDFPINLNDQKQIFANFTVGSSDGYIGALFLDAQKNVLNNGKIYKLANTGSNNLRSSVPLFNFSNTGFDVPKNSKYMALVFVYNPNNESSVGNVSLSELAIHMTTKTFENVSLLNQDYANSSFDLNHYNWIVGELQVSDDLVFINWIKNNADKPVYEVDFSVLEQFSASMDKISLMTSDPDIDNWNADISILDDVTQMVYFLSDETKANTYMSDKTKVEGLCNSNYLNLYQYYSTGLSSGNAGYINQTLKNSYGFTNYFLNIESFREKFDTTEIADYFLSSVLDVSMKYPSTGTGWLTRNDLKLELIDQFYNQPDVDIQDKFDAFVSVFQDKGYTFFELFESEYTIGTTSFNLTGTPINVAGKKYQYCIIKSLFLGGDSSIIEGYGVDSEIITKAEIYTIEAPTLSVLESVKTQNDMLQFNDKIYSVIKSDKIKDIIAISKQDTFYYSNTVKLYMAVRDVMITRTQKQEWLKLYFKNHNSDFFVQLNEIYDEDYGLLDTFSQYLSQTAKKYKQVSWVKLETTPTDIESFKIMEFFKKKGDTVVHTPYKVELVGNQLDSINQNKKIDITNDYTVAMQAGVPYNIMDTLSKRNTLRYKFTNEGMLHVRNIHIDFSSTLDFGSNIEVYLGSSSVPVYTIPSSELTMPSETFVINVGDYTSNVVLKPTSTDVNWSDFRVTNIRIEDNSGVMHSAINCSAADIMISSTISQSFKMICEQSLALMFYFDQKDTTAIALTSEGFTIDDSYCYEESVGINDPLISEIDFTENTQFLSFPYLTTYFGNQELYNLIKDLTANYNNVFDTHFNNFREIIEYNDLENVITLPQIVYNPYFVGTGEININQSIKYAYDFHYNCYELFSNISMPIIENQYIVLNGSLINDDGISWAYHLNNHDCFDASNYSEVYLNKPNQDKKVKCFFSSNKTTHFDNYKANVIYDLTGTISKQSSSLDTYISFAKSIVGERMPSAGFYSTTIGYDTYRNVFTGSGGPYNFDGVNQEALLKTSSGKIILCKNYQENEFSVVENNGFSFETEYNEYGIYKALKFDRRTYNPISDKYTFYFDGYKFYKKYMYTTALHNFNKIQLVTTFIY